MAAIQAQSTTEAAAATVTIADHNLLDERETENKNVTSQVSGSERSDETNQISVPETALSSSSSVQAAAKADDASPSSSAASPTAQVDSDSPNDSKASSAQEDDATESQTPALPQLPSEPIPETEDDGWTYQWDPVHQAYYFLNRFTGQTTWENPRQAVAVTVTVASSSTANPTPAPPPLPTVAGGYNPAIHGDYDDWLAEQKKAGRLPGEEDVAEDPPLFDPTAPAPYASGTQFNRLTGQYQQPGSGLERHSEDAKSHRQMNAFFDVDAAANSHDGRSLKAERAGKRLTKGELKHFKEKRKAKKEEKRRAWLRD